jgi:hypothetical protein
VDGHLATFAQHMTQGLLAASPAVGLEVMAELMAAEVTELVRGARQCRQTTDRRLAERAARLGFADFRTYLADRVTQQAWTHIRVANGLGVDRNTVRDRLGCYGLRRAEQTARLRESLPGTGLGEMTTWLIPPPRTATCILTPRCGTRPGEAVS